MNPELDIAAFSMTEILRLQDRLSQELVRRFEVPAAVCFTDIAGSTSYFARFGDGAGRQLQLLHLQQLERVLAAHGGRLVDTAGDGAVTFFPSATAAAVAMCALQDALSEQNLSRGRDHQLVLRIGIHWGRLLTDGQQFAGDLLNLCARIAASADPGQIRLSHECFREIDSLYRLRCRLLGDVELKGAARPLSLLAMDWLDRERVPAAVLVHETGERIDLPLQDIVSFGRMDIIEGMSANDVVLSLPDGLATRQISRWHFELRRSAGAYRLRSVTNHPTVVDGTLVARGEEVPVRPGSVVTLSGVITLEFLGTAQGEGTRADVTMIRG